MHIDIGIINHNFPHTLLAILILAHIVCNRIKPRSKGIPPLKTGGLLDNLQKQILEKILRLLFIPPQHAMKIVKHPLAISGIEFVKCGRIAPLNAEHELFIGKRVVFSQEHKNLNSA